MYVWMWRTLPGSVAVRALTVLVLVVGVLALLMLVVFPGVEPLLPFNAVSVVNPG